jgi:hypothetical protein
MKQNPAMKLRSQRVLFTSARTAAAMRAAAPSQPEGAGGGDAVSSDSISRVRSLSAENWAEKRAQMPQSVP